MVETPSSTALHWREEFCCCFFLSFFCLNLLHYQFFSVRWSYERFMLKIDCVLRMEIFLFFVFAYGRTKQIKMVAILMAINWIAFCLKLTYHSVMFRDSTICHCSIVTTKRLKVNETEINHLLNESRKDRQPSIVLHSSECYFHWPYHFWWCDFVDFSQCHCCDWPLPGLQCVAVHYLEWPIGHRHHPNRSQIDLGLNTFAANL